MNPVPVPILCHALSSVNTAPNHIFPLRKQDQVNKHGTPKVNLVSLYECVFMFLLNWCSFDFIDLWEEINLEWSLMIYVFVFLFSQTFFFFHSFSPHLSWKSNYFLDRWVVFLFCFLNKLKTEYIKHLWGLKQRIQTFVGKSMPSKSKWLQEHMDFPGELAIKTVRYNFDSKTQILSRPVS